jgi:hypothetical protein
VPPGVGIEPYKLFNLFIPEDPDKKNGAIAIGVNSKSKRGLQSGRFSQNELSLSARLARFHCVDQD